MFLSGWRPPVINDRLVSCRSRNWYSRRLAANSAADAASMMTHGQHSSPEQRQGPDPTGRGEGVAFRIFRFDGSVLVRRNHLCGCDYSPSRSYSAGYALPETRGSRRANGLNGLLSRTGDLLTRYGPCAILLYVSGRIRVKRYNLPLPI